MVANAEVARVTVASELDSYREAGAEQVEYLVADPCDECQEKLDASPIDIGEEWPTATRRYTQTACATSRRSWSRPS